MSGRSKPARGQRKKAAPACLPPGILNTIQCGDADFLLSQLPANSVDMVITSPPYFQQRKYNESGMGIGNERFVEDYIASLLAVFEQTVRVIKPAGNIVYNVGDKYLQSSLLLAPFRFAIAASQVKGVSLINNITWVKSNPTPRQYTRRLVSSTEPFFHFAKTAAYYYDRDAFLQEENPAVSKPGKNLGEGYRSKIDESSLSKDQKRKAHKDLNDVIRKVKAGELSGFRMKIKGVHAEAFGGGEGGRKSQMERQGYTIIHMRGKRFYH